MCSIETGKTCDNCLEYVVHTDSGMDLEFTFDPRDRDNDVIKTWFFATDYVDSISVRSVGNTVWSVITKEEWENEQA